MDPAAESETDPGVDNGFDGLAAGPEGDRPMSFFEHLNELRQRLTRAVLSIVAAAVASFVFAPQLITFLRRPLDLAWQGAGLEGPAHLQSLEIQQPLMVDVRVALTAGIFIAAPVVFYQLWMFVSPGLYTREKRWVVPFVVISAILFSVGAGFAFEFVLPFGYQWMLEYAMDRGQEMQLEIGNYYKGTTRVLLAFGTCFQFPLLIAFLAKAGVLTHRTLLRFWRASVLVIFIVAAFLTPPEPVTQLMMAGPLIFLFFASVGVAYLINPGAPPESRSDDP